jgi:Putative  PD-(D/E)XK family member, (DUF4420)
MSNLYEQFLQLPQAQLEGTFAAIQLSQVRRDFLAKDRFGAPVFLLHDESNSTFTPGVTLKTIKVQYHVICQIETDKKKADGKFALIFCDANTPDLHELFTSCVAPALARLPESAQTSDIATLVAALLDLFRAMNAPGRKDIVGLWAELFVITLMKDTADAVRAWHANPYERFDFSSTRSVLEVKASHSSHRIHEFSLHQLQPPSGKRGGVVSLLLQSEADGIGVLDLAYQIEALLNGSIDLREKLWSNVVKALGSDFTGKLDHRFSLAVASKELRVLGMRDIPAPDQPTDTRISDIRFRVDLTNIALATHANASLQLDALFTV